MTALEAAYAILSSLPSLSYEDAVFISSFLGTILSGLFALLSRQYSRTKILKRLYSMNVRYENYRNSLKPADFEVIGICVILIIIMIFVGSSELQIVRANYGLIFFVIYFVILLLPTATLEILKKWKTKRYLIIAYTLSRYQPYLILYFYGSVFTSFFLISGTLAVLQANIETFTIFLAIQLLMLYLIRILKYPTSKTIEQQIFKNSFRKALLITITTIDTRLKTTEQISGSMESDGDWLIILDKATKRHRAIEWHDIKEIATP